MKPSPFALPSDKDEFISEYSARMSECIRDVLTCSCQLDPDITPTVRRVRVASAIAELTGRDPDFVLHKLIEAVMQQEAIYGSE